MKRSILAAWWGVGASMPRYTQQQRPDGADRSLIAIDSATSRTG
jgi:hypothetical protein